MLKISKLQLKKGGSVQQIQNYLEKSGEYYAQENNKVLPDGKWWGGLSDQLNLNGFGRDQKRDFALMLAGFNPSDKSELVQNAGKSQRVLGFDLTFSAEKSYSIAISTAPEEERRRMIEAHERANNKALEWVQTELTSRAGKGGDSKVKVTGLAVRQVMHMDSRNGDPQVHTHNVVCSVVACADGKTRALDATNLITKNQAKSLRRTAGDIYRHHVAQEFQKLGYGIDRGLALDQYGKPYLASSIVGISKQVCDEFSSRRQEILEEAKRTGKSLNEVAETSRKRKGTENEPAEVCLNATRRISDMHKQQQIDWINPTQLHGAESNDIQPNRWLDDLHVTQSSFSRYHFFEMAIRNCPLDADPAASAQHHWDNFRQNGQIMELGRGKFCTKEQWDIELDCQVRAQNRHNDQAVRLQPGVVQDALAAHEREQGFWLTQEQRGAVEFVTMRSGGVACVSGFAGSGKTATAGAYIKAFEASGYTVIGTSTSQKATDNLAQEGKIKAFNTAALLQQLDNGKMTLPEKCVVILDEAGMVGAKTFQRLQHHIDARGGKLVAVGDALQLQPIQAGSPFRHVVNDIGDTKQTEIRRQKNQELNKMANDWYGGKSGVDIVSDLKSQGRAVVGRDHEVKNNLVQDYLASSKPPQDKLIIAQTRDECRQVSDLMREQMKAHGKLGFSHSVEIEREESKVKIKERLELAAGDRIRLTRNQKKSWFG